MLLLVAGQQLLGQTCRGFPAAGRMLYNNFYGRRKTHWHFKVKQKHRHYEMLTLDVHSNLLISSPFKLAYTLMLIVS